VGGVLTELVYAMAGGRLFAALELNVLDALSVPAGGAEVPVVDPRGAVLLIAIGRALWRISRG
jgi:hypothetical protein